jgi:sugar phosphate isomerase/epimerase
MNNKLQFFCPHWGSESLSFAAFLDKVKDAGYDGVEMSLPFDDSERQQIMDAINSRDLQLIAQHWETVDKDFETHLENYKKRLYNLASVHPLFINSQTGKDYYSIEQNLLLLKAAAEISENTGIRIIHETHRGKFSFAAHITETYLNRFPSLQLCLDISHWCCVAETMLEDQEVQVEKAIMHTTHIHSRVGFAEGPQVMDPRAPEWKEVLDKHLKWWQKVIDHHKNSNWPVTITTEFGPYPYLQHFPYSNMPIYSQWEVNVFMMNLLRSRLK